MNLNGTWSTRRFVSLTVIWIAAGTAVFAGVATSTEVAKDAPMLTAGKRFETSIEVGESAWQTFRITVPENALQIDLQLDGAIGDLDLYIKHDAEMLDWEEADFSAELSDFNERLTLTRWDTDFASGVYYVDVVYFGGRVPRIDGRRVDTFDFGITYNFVVADEGEPLTIDEALDGVVAVDHAQIAFYHIDVPEESECLRIDLFGAQHALDIFLSRAGPMIDTSEADFYSDNWARTKTLLIDDSSDPPLQPGRYYIAIRDYFNIDSTFTMLASLSPEPPQDRLEIPAIETPDSPLKLAYVSTVMLITETGIGSGTILTPDGLILTNHHVVEDYDAGIVPMDQPIVVGVALDPTKPVVEMFRAEVRKLDKAHDLALVEIVSGVYDQPLPEEFELPYNRIAEKPLPDFGDELIMIGYPAIGSSTSGCYVSITRGIVSGFDRGIEGLMIKTDADIAGGNSGGSGLNTDYELIGIPTQSISENDDNGQMGYLVPTTSISEEWIELIQSRLPTEVAEGSSDSVRDQ